MDNVPRISGLIVSSEAVEAFVNRVRERFPRMILSADVFAGAGARRSLGQDTILQHLDIIMPMEYTSLEFTVKDIKESVQFLRSNYSGKPLIAVVRTWSLGGEGLLGLKMSVLADLTAVVEAGTRSYGLFTYESLLELGNPPISTTLNILRADIRY